MKIASFAGKADPTTAAEDARRRAAQGQATSREVEAAELIRQAAVRSYDKLLLRDFAWATTQGHARSSDRRLRFIRDD